MTIAVSYWVTLMGFDDQPTWEGMVYAHEENGQLQVHKNEMVNNEFFQVVQTSQSKQVKWEKVWEDITNQRRLPPGNTDG